MPASASWFREKRISSLTAQPVCGCLFTRPGPHILQGAMSTPPDGATPGVPDKGWALSCNSKLFTPHMSLRRTLRKAASCRKTPPQERSCLPGLLPPPSSASVGPGYRLNPHPGCPLIGVRRLGDPHQSGCKTCAQAAGLQAISAERSGSKQQRDTNSHSSVQLPILSWNSLALWTQMLWWPWATSPLISEPLGTGSHTHGSVCSSPLSHCCPVHNFP